MYMNKIAAGAHTYGKPGEHSPERLARQYMPLVRKIAWHVAGRAPSTIEVEDLIQIGMIALIEAHPEQLRFSGFMGYDAHVGKLPAFIQSAEEGHRETEAIYQRYIDKLYQLNPAYQQQTLCFNGAGSPTVALYDNTAVVNELSAGSCLVKASDFDLPLLAERATDLLSRSLESLVLRDDAGTGAAARLPRPFHPGLPALHRRPVGPALRRVPRRPPLRRSDPSGPERRTGGARGRGHRDNRLFDVLQ
mgnify:CR=1 FL=1